MKSTLIFDAGLPAIDPNDPDYTNGQDPLAFRADMNQRLGNFAQQCLGSKAVNFQSVETLSFDDFCKLLSADWDYQIIGGSAFSVHDDQPWIHRLKAALIETRKSTRSPIFGICFGAQILAVAGGASVKKLSQPRKGTVPIASGELVRVSHTEIIQPTDHMTVTHYSADGLPYIIESGRDKLIQPHPEVTVMPNQPRVWQNLLKVEAV